MVTCGKADAGDGQTILDPKLIIEVLSPSAKGYDKRDKFIVYRTLASSREYVLIDPAKRLLEVFTLTPGGAWLLTDQTGAEDLTWVSIDCKVSMALVFKGVEAEAVGWPFPRDDLASKAASGCSRDTLGQRLSPNCALLKLKLKT
jgi:Uma2 family endonuclease